VQPSFPEKRDLDVYPAPVSPTNSRQRGQKEGKKGEKASGWIRDEDQDEDRRGGKGNESDLLLDILLLEGKKGGKRKEEGVVRHA